MQEPFMDFLHLHSVICKYIYVYIHMYSYVCVRSCMFYLCSILNAAIYTPKQTNGIQYGNYTGNCKRTEGKGSWKRERGKGEQTFSQAFHPSAFKCFFLELPPLLLLLCPRLLSSCRMQNSPPTPWSISTHVCLRQWQRLVALSIIICSPRLATTCQRVSNTTGNGALSPPTGKVG